ncbi:MAG: STAS domain-containing protein [Ruminococcaceae bacterium]|nr:STAS domain-containing protein [Oscillospiraceae bacterium]
MTTELKNRILIAHIDGELDHYSASEIRRKLDREITGCSVKHLIFDFSDLSFMDSSGLGVIIGRYKKIKEKNGKVLLVCNKAHVDKLLSVSGLKKLLGVNKTVEGAMKQIKEEKKI